MYVDVYRCITIIYIVILCTATRTQSQFSEFLKQLTMVPHLFSIQYPSKACFCNKYLPKAENDLWIDTFLKKIFKIQSVSSVTQLCPTLCDPKDCNTPGFPVHHQLPKSTQTHAHHVGDATQPSHSLLFPSPPTFNLF